MKSNVACTLRLEPELYTGIKKIARNRHTSFTAFVQSLLADALKSEEQKALYNAFSVVGEDADLEYAASSQREVVEHHE